MKEKIEFLLENRNCRYLELNLKNGDSFSIYQPNQSDMNIVELLDNDMVKWIQRHEDGCTYENFINISEIAFITGLYGCPEGVVVNDEDLYTEDDE